MDAHHQPIARAGAEPGPDVQPRGHSQQRQSAREQQDLRPEPIGLGQYPQADLDGRTDQQHVHDGTDPWPLADGDPQQQDQNPDDVGDDGEVETGFQHDSLAQHVPG